jgi:hypothetical protein
MFDFIRNIAGWSALLAIAIAIALGQFLGGLKWVRRILWVLAAVFAAFAALNEWSSRK